MLFFQWVSYSFLGYLDYVSYLDQITRLCNLYSLFVFASLAIGAVETFEPARELCAIKVIKLSRFLRLKHFSKSGILSFKLD